MTPDGFSPPLGLHPRPVLQDIELKPGDRLANDVLLVLGEPADRV